MLFGFVQNSGVLDAILLCDVRLCAFCDKCRRAKPCCGKRFCFECCLLCLVVPCAVILCCSVMCKMMLCLKLAVV